MVIKPNTTALNAIVFSVFFIMRYVKSVFMMNMKKYIILKCNVLTVPKLITYYDSLDYVEICELPRLTTRRFILTYLLNTHYHNFSFVCKGLWRMLLDSLDCVIYIAYNFGFQVLFILSSM